MKMQDKEFDDLFRAKLDGFEAEPSASVWAGIEDGLTRKRSLKSFMPLMRIAAGMLIVLSIGLIFMQKVDKNTNRLSGSRQSAGKPATAISPAAAPDRQVIAKVTSTQHGSEPLSIAATRVPATTHRHKIKSTEPSSSKPMDDQEQLPAKAEPELLALSTTAQMEIGEAVPENKTARPSLSAVVINQPEVATAPSQDNQLPVKKQAGKIASRSKVITLGDMLNAVISKVDKRKDKVIEFANTDGDESSITGINLGIIKIKKEN